MESYKDRPLTTPVIFILGTTGVGKSKLSLDLAQRLNGEIINADSMQIYQGNEGIMTAKPSPSEKALVTHHLYDEVDVFEKTFNVQKYRARALQQIAEVQKRGKLPIVVGGTNYYIEAILFEESKPGEEGVSAERIQEALALVASEKGKQMVRDICDNFNQKYVVEEKYGSGELHGLLEVLDPAMAKYLHSNDQRRIVNALLKYFKHSNLKESDIQCQGEGMGLSLRVKPILIQMMAEQGILEARITKRVGQMLEENDGAGLKEVLDIFELFRNENIKNKREEMEFDFEKGILQAIGYKEFFPFFQYCHSTGLSSSAFSYSTLPPEALSTISTCSDRLIQRTLQYSAQQVKWLRKRIHSLFLQPSLPLLLLITLNDPKDYESKALSQSLAFVEQTRQALESADLSQYCREYSRAKEERMREWTKNWCEPCGIEVNGSKQWEAHLMTRKHRNRVFAKEIKENKEQIVGENRKKKAFKEQQKDPFEEEQPLFPEDL